MASEFAIFLDIFQRTLTIYLGVALGFLFIKSPLKKFRHHFIQVTISLITPFLIIVSFLRITNDSNWIYPVVGSILVTLVGIVTPKLLYRLKGSKEPDAAEICTAAFPNALNFPFPIIYAFSPDSLGAASIFLAVAIVLRNTVGLWIAGINLSKNEIKQIISFPPIWGILFGILLKPFVKPSDPILELTIVNFVFELGIIMTIMTIGFSFSKPDVKFLEPILRVGITRFLISGILVILIVMSTSIPDLFALPLIVQMISPPAVYNGLYAEKFNMDTELTGQVILTLTLVALILLPLELFILQIIFL